jgi:L-amino acid N-acyltransferase YncA
MLGSPKRAVLRPRGGGCFAGVWRMRLAYDNPVRHEWPMLRLALPADGARIAEIYAPAVTKRTASFELVPPDGMEMARRISAVTARTPWLVLEENGRVLGYAYASPHRDRPAYQWSVEVSAYIDAAAHRAGHAKTLYTALLDILTAQGFANAYAAITLPNPASVGFHQAMGFEEIGIYRGIGYKFGSWHDVIWLYRPLAPKLPDMSPPRALAEVLASRPLR